LGLPQIALSLALMLSFAVGLAVSNDASAAVSPPAVEETVPRGTSIDVAKLVGTPEIPPVLDFCLLVDLSGSYNDDLPNIKALAPGLVASIEASGADVQFCLATFVDFPINPYGAAGDYEYLLNQDLGDSASWTAAVNAMGIFNGVDTPESQYEALSRIAVGPGAPAWRSGATRVVAITTDASFHDSDFEGAYPGVGGTQSTADLVGEEIIVIAIKAPGSGGQMDAVAAATGGSVQTTGSSSAEIADAVLAGLSAIPTTVIPTPVGCDPDLSVSFAPPTDTVNSGDDAAFLETIAVADDPALEGTTVSCSVSFADADGNPLGEQTITIHVPDQTPPEVSCVETVNPHGNTTPPAGSTTLPGSKGGMNEDGYYELIAVDNVDADPQIFVVDTGSGTVFGPFASGDVIKYTEDADATPESKKIGSTNGQAGAVDAHIIGNGDAAIYGVDASGNVSDPVSCLVPPLPK
jgi:hypothetical protein